MNGKRWAALGIAAAVLLVSVVVSAFSSFFLGNGKNSLTALMDSDLPFSEEIVEDGDLQRKIVVLELNGTIQDTGDSDALFSAGGYNHQLFMEKLNAIKDDRTVRGLILKVNSPGGGVVESAEIHDKLVEIIEEKQKPVYISMGSMAASGGYYISAPATKIFASPDTITGSLGVIMESYNYAELAEKLGIDTVTIKSGPYKDIMSGSREMTAEERAILQEMIDNAYNGFVKVIADGREMTEEAVRQIADGRIYDGRQALEIGLIDEFGYLEDAIAAMKKEEKLNNAMVVKYQDSTLGLGSLLSFAAKNITGKDANSALVEALMTQRNSPKLMYLYSE
ncbi:signal peptide peptidase SppA [Caldibacillus lycopersici]|uniref:Signal peptide peptidase SppA n=1 Tax=Perspicuibacillus lycopersici TaxID=1325689 RepID=A0AAE3LN28_9BACI|nr:signal peptide peptidase SppA [Perspicuibacillus lycopersici]MCU9614215.1 signal peptide peptidase SppA [Perspicuibacillus lycopersici]